jgi:hypothetical protein
MNFHKTTIERKGKKIFIEILFSRETRKTGISFS